MQHITLVVTLIIALVFLATIINASTAITMNARFQNSKQAAIMASGSANTTIPASVSVPLKAPSVIAPASKKQEKTQKNKNNQENPQKNITHVPSAPLASASGVGAQTVPVNNNKTSNSLATQGENRVYINRDQLPSAASRVLTPLRPKVGFKSRPELFEKYPYLQNSSVNVSLANSEEILTVLGLYNIYIDEIVAGKQPVPSELDFKHVCRNKFGYDESPVTIPSIVASNTRVASTPKRAPHSYKLEDLFEPEILNANEQIRHAYNAAKERIEKNEFKSKEGLIEYLLTSACKAKYKAAASSSSTSSSPSDEIPVNLSAAIKSRRNNGIVIGERAKTSEKGSPIPIVKPSPLPKASVVSTLNPKAKPFTPKAAVTAPPKVLPIVQKPTIAPSQTGTSITAAKSDGRDADLNPKKVETPSFRVRDFWLHLERNPR